MKATPCFEEWRHCIATPGLTGYSGFTFIQGNDTTVTCPNSASLPYTECFFFFLFHLLPNTTMSEKTLTKETPLKKAAWFCAKIVSVFS